MDDNLLVSNPDNEKSEIKETEKRTDLAKMRTLLAHERTYHAWLRTGIASSAAGVALSRFLTIKDLEWIPKIMAFIFIILSIGIYSLGLIRYIRGYIILKREGIQGESPLWVIILITGFLLVGSLFAFALTLY